MKNHKIFDDVHHLNEIYLSPSQLFVPHWTYGKMLLSNESVSDINIINSPKLNQHNSNSYSLTGELHNNANILRARLSAQDETSKQGMDFYREVDQSNPFFPEGGGRPPKQAVARLRVSPTASTFINAWRLEESLHHDFNPNNHRKFTHSEFDDLNDQQTQKLLSSGYAVFSKFYIPTVPLYYQGQQNIPMLKEFKKEGTDPSSSWWQLPFSGDKANLYFLAKSISGAINSMPFKSGICLIDHNPSSGQPYSVYEKVLFFQTLSHLLSPINDISTNSKLTSWSTSPALDGVNGYVDAYFRLPADTTMHRQLDYHRTTIDPNNLLKIDSDTDSIYQQLKVFPFQPLGTSLETWKEFIKKPF